MLIPEKETKSEPCSSSDELVALCLLDELPIGLGRTFSVAGRTIAVFLTRKGKLLAVDNRCPHKGGPLAEGMLAGDQIVCPLHAFRFDGLTGECDQPDQCSVKTYPVTETDGIVSIRLSGSSRK